MVQSDRILLFRNRRVLIVIINTQVAVVTLALTFTPFLAYNLELSNKFTSFSLVIILASFVKLRRLLFRYIIHALK